MEFLSFIILLGVRNKLILLTLMYYLPSIYIIYVLLMCARLTVSIKPDLNIMQQLRRKSVVQIVYFLHLTFVTFHLYIVKCGSDLV